jgi:hypothetical protein
VREQVDDHIAFPQHASTVTTLLSYPTVQEFLYHFMCEIAFNVYKVLGSYLSVTSLSLQAIKRIVVHMFRIPYHNARSLMIEQVQGLVNAYPITP